MGGITASLEPIGNAATNIARNGRAALQVRSMCNLYSITKNQDAIRRLFTVEHDYTGNLPPMPSVFPDYPAPVVRNGARAAS